MPRRVALTLAAFAAAAAWALAARAGGPDAETVSIMPFVADRTACTRCHDTSERAALAANPARACTEFCTTCHKPEAMDEHHKVGIPVPSEAKAGVLRTRGGTTACFTCHDLEQPRFDRTPWKSASLFDRVFRRQARYKTYYLVTRNDRGQLCRNCH